MPFSVNDRVKVTDQSSVYRNQLGTVVDAAEDDTSNVRLDGRGVDSKINFTDAQLMESTLPCPFTYPEIHVDAR